MQYALHANMNRDPKQTPEPFLPSDVHPYRTADEYGKGKKQVEKADRELFAKVARKVTRLRAKPNAHKVKPACQAER